MDKYYGVMTDTLTKDFETIEGEYEFKPSLEECSRFCSCHWFKTIKEQIVFMNYCLTKLKFKRRENDLS